MAMGLKIRLKAMAVSIKLAGTGSDLIEMDEFSVIYAPEGRPVPLHMNLSLGAVSPS